MLICHGNRDRLADSIISLGGTLSMRRMLSVKKLEKLGAQNLKLSKVQQHWWRKKLREPIVPDLCRFSLGWYASKKFPIVHKVFTVIIFTPVGGGYIPDFENFSFSCLGYSEVSTAVNSVRSFFGQADVAACAFIEDKIVPGCVEVAQKFKRFQDPERAITWYAVFIRTRELPFGTYVSSLRAGGLATRYSSVDEYTSWCSEGLARRRRASPTKADGATAASSTRPGAQEMLWLVATKLTAVRPFYWVNCSRKTDNR